MTEPQLVFAENSPYDSVEAIIEQDDEVAYFYLRGIQNQDFGFRPCWIRNFRPAPDELDRDRLQAGLPPTLPKKFCRFPEGQPKLKQENLRVVWFEEGDGAALLEDDQFLAIIPPWAGQENFDGYARDCVGESPFCWEPKDSKAMVTRIAAADQYWKSWETKQSPWHLHQPLLIKAYEKVFGESDRFYSIDAEQWPPKGLLCFDLEDQVILATVGVSCCPQPRVEMVFDHPGPFRRFELACSLKKPVTDSMIETFGGYISGQTRLPWDYQTFFAHGHTIGCNVLQGSDEFPDFSSVLLWNHQKLSSTANLPILPEVLGDPVNLLWMVPLFENERLFAAENGSDSILPKVLQKHAIPMVEHRSPVI